MRNQLSVQQKGAIVFCQSFRFFLLSNMDIDQIILLATLFVPTKKKVSPRHRSKTRQLQLTTWSQMRLSPSGKVFPEEKVVAEFLKIPLLLGNKKVQLPSSKESTTGPYHLPDEPKPQTHIPVCL
jgi:hypothetical protein